MARVDTFASFYDKLVLFYVPAFVNRLNILKGIFPDHLGFLGVQLKVRRDIPKRKFYDRLLGLAVLRKKFLRVSIDSLLNALFVQLIQIVVFYFFDFTRPRERDLLHFLFPKLINVFRSEISRQKNIMQDTGGVIPELDQIAALQEDLEILIGNPFSYPVFQARYFFYDRRLFVLFYLKQIEEFFQTVLHFLVGLHIAF